MELKRVFDLLDFWRDVYRTEEAFVSIKNGRKEILGSRKFVDETYLLSYALMDLGLEKGENVLIVTDNRPEWNIIDMAVSQIGAIPIVLYTSLLDKELEYIMKLSDTKIIFVENEALYRRIKEISAQSQHVEHVFTIEEVKGAAYWHDLLSDSDEKTAQYSGKLESIKENILPQDVFSVVFTSGTTGAPKGVMLSHENIVSNILATNNTFSVNEGERTFCFLPVAHILSRMTNYWYQLNGNTIYYAQNRDTLIDDLRICQPHTLVVVPLMVEKLHNTLIETGESFRGFKRLIFRQALKLAEKYEIEHQPFFFRQKLSYADKLVLSKIRDIFGGELRTVISGGAALPTHSQRLFFAAGINLVEGYGLTETSPVVCVTNESRGEIKFGKVGRPVENVKIRIDEDGEILVKGPNVMLGYYKDKARTDEVLQDGWLRTGDIGEIDSDGYLSITDRKKEIFKLKNGRYVAPQKIENILKSSIFIDRAIVVGENQDFVTTILSPNFSHLHKWASEQKIAFSTNKELVQSAAVRMSIQSEINRVNKMFADFRQIRDFEIVADVWSAESGELSPTMKLKRKAILEKYQSLIDEMYIQGCFSNKILAL